MHCARAAIAAQLSGVLLYRGQMSAEEVRDILWQLLQALRYLHGTDVWHRDLKSSNLLLSRAGGRRIVKVLHAMNCMWS